MHGKGAISYLRKEQVPRRPWSDRLPFHEGGCLCSTASHTRNVQASSKWLDPCLQSIAFQLVMFGSPRMYLPRQNIRLGLSV